MGWMSRRKVRREIFMQIDDFGKGAYLKPGLAVSDHVDDLGNIITVKPGFRLGDPWGKELEDMCLHPMNESTEPGEAMVNLLVLRFVTNTLELFAGTSDGLDVALSGASDTDAWNDGAEILASNYRAMVPLTLDLSEVQMKQAAAIAERRIQEWVAESRK
jgi:hypothetical protein